MPKTPEQAIADAAAQSKSDAVFGYGLCLQRVRLCYDVASYAKDAATAWLIAEHKHRTSDPAAIPRGVPVFWTGGSSGHGHIAIAAGDGMCWSTDIRRIGHFDRVPIAEIHDRWGLALVGWTEDINRVRVWTDPQEDEMKPEDFDRIEKMIDKALDGKVDQIAAATAKAVLDSDVISKLDVSVREALRSVFNETGKAVRKK